jgi:chaperone modulatory protein CbpM
MSTELVDAAWLSESGQVSLEELAALSGLAPAALRELVDYGVLRPVDTAEVQWSFGAHWVVMTRTACRLRDDFELDLDALALTVSFLDRIRDLEVQLRSAHARLPGRLR